MKSVTEHRTSGVLLHPTSFPGGPIGTLGGEARRWVEWLRAAGQGIWQVLPLVAVDEGGSPYNGLSALAGNALLLDPERLAETGWLAATPPAVADTTGADFAAAAARTDRLLREAQRSLAARPDQRARFDAFCRHEAYWLEDFALFRALREVHGAGWLAWPRALRDREPEALRRAADELAADVERHALGQYLFDAEWAALRRSAQRAGIRVIGDMPIFVAHDSADVWAHPELFQLDAEGRSRVVSGVPPDYFSETGQLWGNPLYDWDAMRRDGFRWWIERFRRTLTMVDVVRIDHFRGFESAWEVAAGADTAIHGRWVRGPGLELFHAVTRALGPLPLIAEDLGIITPEVDALREALGMPGMRVLQFAFSDDPGNPHLPTNYPADSIAYTGTHDNDTALGWWTGGATAGEREGMRALIGDDHGDMVWSMIGAVLRSPAGVAVVPLQDLLGLGSEGRMNVPGISSGNWSWRYQHGALRPELAARLRDLTLACGRSPWMQTTR